MRGVLKLLFLSVLMTIAAVCAFIATLGIVHHGDSQSTLTLVIETAYYVLLWPFHLVVVATGGLDKSLAKVMIIVSGCVNACMVYTTLYIMRRLKHPEQRRFFYRDPPPRIFHRAR